VTQAIRLADIWCNCCCHVKHAPYLDSQNAVQDAVAFCGDVNDLIRAINQVPAQQKNEYGVLRVFIFAAGLATSSCFAVSAADHAQICLVQRCTPVGVADKLPELQVFILNVLSSPGLDLQRNIHSGMSAARMAWVGWDLQLLLLPHLSDFSNGLGFKESLGISSSYAQLLLRLRQASVHLRQTRPDHLKFSHGMLSRSDQLHELFH
jgi:hypothetical protein